MLSIVLHCPALGRDLRPLHEAVPDLAIYESERSANGAESCLRGHQGIVDFAARSGVDRVFVLEDDCQFTPAFSFERWSADADWAIAHGYDVLVGGSTRTYDPRWVREGLIEVSAFHSAHCVVYMESAFEKVMKAVAPVDWSLGRDCGARSVLAWPFVAVQRPAFSGIEQHQVNYVPLYQEHERYLQHVLGVLR